MARRGRKPKGPKKIAYELIPESGDFGEALYARLTKLVLTHHEDISDARIALAWCDAWKPDADGRMTLGMCRRASDLDRQLHDYDFIILLNRGFWTALSVTNEQRDALLDHELCHAAVRIDKETGDPARDEKGRILYRIRKHDLEEFACIAERHGVWKKDLEFFARSLARNVQGRFTFSEKVDKKNGGGKPTLVPPSQPSTH